MLIIEEREFVGERQERGTLRLRGGSEVDRGLVGEGQKRGEENASWGEVGERM